MSEQIILDGSIKVTNSLATSSLDTPVPISMSDTILERFGGRVDLAEAASDVEVSLPRIEFCKYLLVKSDVVVQMKINSTGNTPITGREILIGAGSARSLYFTNLGLLHDEGQASAGGAATLTDTAKQWTYTKVTGTRVIVPAKFDEREIRMHVNGRSDTLTLTVDDVVGTVLATTIQTAIDASAIGASQVTVAWDATNEVLTFENLRDGANPILFESVAGDGDILGILGLVTQTTELGGDKLDAYRLDVLAGTGLDQTKTIVSNTAPVITVSGDWTTPPDSTSFYRIYKPSDGELTIFAAR